MDTYREDFITSTARGLLVALARHGIPAGTEAEQAAIERAARLADQLADTLQARGCVEWDTAAPADPKQYLRWLEARKKALRGDPPEPYRPSPGVPTAPIAAPAPGKTPSPKATDTTPGAPATQGSQASSTPAAVPCPQSQPARKKRIGKDEPLPIVRPCVD